MGTIIKGTFEKSIEQQLIDSLNANAKKILADMGEQLDCLHELIGDVDQDEDQKPEMKIV